MMNQQHTQFDEEPSEDNLKRAFIEQMRADLAGNAVQQQEFEEFALPDGDYVDVPEQAKGATSEPFMNEPQSISIARPNLRERLWFKPLQKLWQLLTMPVANRL